MISVGVDDDETLLLLRRYADRLDLPTTNLRVTTDRRVFEAWLRRQIRSSVGGAYVYLPHLGVHAILINLPRIDRSRKNALEIVVAEELLHMRDFIDGDRRRHAKHGHDRIAHRVAALTGGTLDDVRSCLIPVERRPLRYLYECNQCGLRVRRRVRGHWSCGRCASSYDPTVQLTLMGELQAV